MRSLAREAVFKYLFSRLFNPSDEGLFAVLCKDLSQENKEFANETDISKIEFNLPIHKEIQDFILKNQKEGKAIRFNELYEVIGEDGSEELSFLAGLETEENKKFDQAMYFFDCVKAIKMDRLSKDIERLTALFEQATETEKRRTYAQEMARLLAEKSKLR